MELDLGCAGDIVESISAKPEIACRNVAYFAAGAACRFPPPWLEREEILMLLQPHSAGVAGWIMLPS
jgi:hypothetical protein